VKAQKTRKYHAEVAQRADGEGSLFFSLAPYKAHITPSEFSPDVPNVTATVRGKNVKLTVLTDKTKSLFAKMRLSIMQTAAGIPGGGTKAAATIQVDGYGTDASTIQAMWNAVDDWVMRSSNFHSLFELYGHFTEPHPMFSVTAFEIFTDHPIALFAKHSADFANCSRYLPKSDLVKLFGGTLNTEDFSAVANYLRAFRFDIRSKETNIAIEADKYMVAYPFSLPKRKQMNFKLHVRQNSEFEIDQVGAA
jgi:DNA (cytosine-5)-methyltransferase 1